MNDCVSRTRLSRQDFKQMHQDFREACDDYIEWKRIRAETQSRCNLLDKLCEHWGNTNV